MTGRVARLAARLDEVEEVLTELLARVERVELHTRTPTSPDTGPGLYDWDRDRGGAS